MTLEESQFYVAKMSKSCWHLTTRHEPLFVAVKITQSCSTEAMYSSTRSLMNREESHFQASKRPNRGFVDARYLMEVE